MPKRRPTSKPLQSYERIGLIVSLLLHAVFIVIVLRSNALHPPTITTINVTIEPPLAKTQRAQPQIVSPSQQPPTLPPENATKLSDKDSRTEVEKIQRGDGGGVPGDRSQSANKQQESPKNPTTPKESQPKPPPKDPSRDTAPRPEEPKHHSSKKELNLKDLTLDQSTLAMKFGTTPKPAAQAKSSQSAAQSISEYQAFSRPPGSGAAFLGTAGISDHLPNLPDGDITLLNAKANIYASFVRRVAVQVFTQLRSQGWERLSGQQIRQLSGFSTIEAILSPDGKFIRAQLLESSGSDAFDSVVNLSVTNGARDPNPPPGALAKDGLIHFIFKARSWSQMGVNRRSGAPMEQRWLLLATGLE
jgi:hypothetical protein